MKKVMIVRVLNGTTYIGELSMARIGAEDRVWLANPRIVVSNESVAHSEILYGVEGPFGFFKSNLEWCVSVDPSTRVYQSYIKATKPKDTADVQANIQSAEVTIQKNT